MKYLISLTLTFCIASSLLSTDLKAQIIKQPSEFNYEINENINLNPFNSQFDKTRSNGKFIEYLAYEVAFAGGALVTSGLFLVGFLAAWSETNIVAYPFIALSFASAIATPIVAGRVLERVGRKYHPEGTRKAAVWGSLIGAVTIGGLALLVNTESRTYNPTRNGLLVTSFFFLPGVVSLIAYNASPSKKSPGTSNSLMNIGNGKFRPGLPAVSISQNPILHDQYFTQFSIARISF